MPSSSSPRRTRTCRSAALSYNSTQDGSGPAVCLRSTGESVCSSSARISYMRLSVVCLSICLAGCLPVDLSFCPSLAAAPALTGQAHGQVRSWKKLHEAITQIFNEDAGALSFEELYRTGYQPPPLSFPQPSHHARQGARACPPGQRVSIRESRPAPPTTSTLFLRPGIPHVHAARVKSRVCNRVAGSLPRGGKVWLHVWFRCEQMRHA